MLYPQQWRGSIILFTILWVLSSSEAKVMMPGGGQVPRVAPENNGTNGNSAHFVPDTTTISSQATSTGMAPRRRSVKVLEKPLDSQLDHERENLLVEEEMRDGVHSSPTHAPRVEKERTSETHRPHANLTTKGTRFQRKRLGSGVVRRQEVELDLTNLVTEGPPVNFEAVVSPIEASFGGLTGVQGLPPLSLVQFLKILVAITPFVIPLVFIPLLVFTVGVTLIPVTRSHLFIERQLNAGSNFLSTYLFHPVKSFGGNVVAPGARHLSTLLANHEECVERLSCEISARLGLQPEWDGKVSWRGLANTNWISSLLQHLWGGEPTVTRIGKGLLVRPGGGVRARGHTPGLREPVSTSSCSNTYTCKPATFLRKLFQSK